MKSRGVMTLLLGLLAAGATHAQQGPDEARGRLRESSSASATSNLPPRSGEASTMTNGVPNLSTSNPQPGELGIQTRLTVRPSPAAAAAARNAANTSVMGGPAAGLAAPERVPAPAAAQGGTPD
jgi:hypothetical protein